MQIANLWGAARTMLQDHRVKKSVKNVEALIELGKEKGVGLANLKLVDKIREDRPTDIALWIGIISKCHQKFGPEFAYYRAHDAFLTTKLGSPLNRVAQTVKRDASHAIMETGVQTNDLEMFMRGHNRFVALCDPNSLLECVLWTDYVGKAAKAFGPQNGEQMAREVIVHYPKEDNVLKLRAQMVRPAYVDAMMVHGVQENYPALFTKGHAYFVDLCNPCDADVCARWQHHVEAAAKVFGLDYADNRINEAYRKSPVFSLLEATAKIARYANADAMLGQGVQEKDQDLFTKGNSIFIAQCDPRDPDDCTKWQGHIDAAIQIFPTKVVSKLVLEQLGSLPHGSLLRSKCVETFVALEKVPVSKPPVPKRWGREQMCRFEG